MQRRFGLRNHDLFVNSILVGGRVSSVRIPQKLKETDCLLTLMILYMHEESYNVQNVLATYY